MAPKGSVVSLLILSLVCSASCTSIVDALNDLYYGTKGPTEWIVNKGWGTGDPYCTWWGVKCTGTSFTLDLRGDGLTGTIPNSLGALGKNITGLFLDENRLQGTIPNSLTNLTKLAQFDVSQNNLTGTVPEGFGNFTNLELFWISDNLLTGYLPYDIAPILAQVVKYQATEGCRVGGNMFCCPVPTWVPPECAMGCKYNISCEVMEKTPLKTIKL